MSREQGLQISGSASIAFFLVTFDNIPLVELLHRPSYYRDLSFTFIAAFLLLNYISLVTGWLDSRIGWQARAGFRVGTQIGLGLMGGALLAYGIAYLQYQLDHEHIFGKDSFLQIEFPVIVLFVFFSNSVYCSLSYYHWQENKPGKFQESPKTDTPGFVPNLLGIQGNRRVNIPIDTVALICVENEMTWIHTFAHTRYHADEALQQLMQRLDPDKFFRVNRQFIVQLSACYSYQSIDFGKIKLVLTPPFNTELVISQKTAPAFRKWIER